MIIRMIATALIQCTIRTHAGWMTFALDGACASLAARLDMVVPSLDTSIRVIRREPLLRYCNKNDQVGARRVRRSQKNEPDCPGSPLPILMGTRSGCAGGYDAGISTGSTTWITPLDWLTFEILTGDEPPFASTI